MEDGKKSNKIREIVRLRQLLKKWKRAAKNSSRNNTGGGGDGGNGTPTSSSSASSKGMKFLKKTLSFNDNSISSMDAVIPKGFLAVSVGKELKRYVIPTEYLSHRAFGILLREAEEEFGFQQEGVLQIPCETPVFEMILKMVEEKRDDFFINGIGCSPDCELIRSPHPQMCR